jgi:Ribbon-helix-helix protein, copG family
MYKIRINIYITAKQKEQLGKMSNAENLPESEIIRRALDAYLAWYDPAYNSEATPHPPTRPNPPIPQAPKGRPIHPPHQ